MSTIENEVFEFAARQHAPSKDAKLLGVVEGIRGQLLGFYQLEIGDNNPAVLKELPADFPVPASQIYTSPSDETESTTDANNNASLERDWGEGIIRREPVFRFVERALDKADALITEMGLVNTSEVDRRTAKETARLVAAASKNIAVGSADVIQLAASQIDPKVRTVVTKAAAVTILTTGILAGANHAGNTSPVNSKPEQIELSDMPAQKFVHFIYTPSRPTHLRTIAKDLNLKLADLEEVNPHFAGQDKVIPAGKHVNVHGVVGVIRTPEPVKAHDVAKLFSLSDDAVSASNIVQEDGTIADEIRVPGRVVYASKAVLNPDMVSDSIGAEADTLRFMNQRSMDGLVIIPADDFISEDQNQQIKTVLEQQAVPSTTMPITVNSTMPTSEVEPSTTTLVTTTEVTTTTLPPETSTTLETTTTTAAAQPSVPAPILEQAAPVAEVVKTPEQKAVDLLNDSLTSVNIMNPTNNLDFVLSAVRIADNAYAPKDPDRRSDLPFGYVKAFMPNEMDGVKQLRVAAERTSGQELYYSAQAESVSRAWAVLMEQLGSKYPQYAQAVLRMRDANSPNHRTHQHGQMFDISSNMSLNVTFTADGPFGDMNSPNYSFDYSLDLANALARLRFGEDPAIRSIVTSDRRLLNAVNAKLGFRFMSYDSDGEHKDHWHVIMNPKFNLPSWGLRARDLPLSTDQDLRIGAAARPISPEQYRIMHGPFDDWKKAKLEAFANATSTTTSTTTTPINTPTTTVPPVTTVQPPVTIPAVAEVVAAQPADAEVQPSYDFIEKLEIAEPQKQFLREVVPYGVAIAKQYQLSPQVLIAQAAMESGYGQSKLAKATNNLFGIKVGSGWGGPSLRARVGSMTKSYVADFRAYFTPLASIEDYAKVISGKPWYNDSRKHPNDPKLYAMGLIHELRDDGTIAKSQGQPGVQSYDVNPKYVDNVLAVIETLHLNEISS